MRTNAPSKPTVLLVAFCTLVISCAAPEPYTEAEASVYAGNSLRNFCEERSCSASSFILERTERDQASWAFYFVNCSSPEGMRVWIAVNDGGYTETSWWSFDSVDAKNRACDHLERK